MTFKRPTTHKCKRKGCREKIELSKYFCSQGCKELFYNMAIEKVKSNRKKEAKKWISDKKKSLLTTSDWLQLLQQVFNKYIRLRDANKPCISSGRPLVGKFDAGHYFSTGSYPNLRFEEDNVHGQSVHDNRDKHGNLAEYLPRLIERVGQERFDALVAKKNGVLKLTEAEIKEKIAYYKEKIKRLESGDLVN